MKKILLAALFAMATLNGFAQTPIEALVGDKQVHYINYWQRDLDSAGRFNFFNLNRFAIDHRDKTRNNFSIDGQLTFQVNRWFGVSAGGAYEGDGFTPAVGLSLGYTSRRGDFVVETYPTVQLGSPVAVDLFGVVIYSPQFNRDWGLFSQLIFSTNLGLEKTADTPTREVLGLFTNHNQSTQLLRIGLNYKQKFQFGFGADLYQLGRNEGTFENVGVFLRFALE